MAEYMHENRWTAGRGTQALGIIGTALGGLATVGGGLGALTSGQGGLNQLQMDLLRAERRNAVLEADLNTERKIYDAVGLLNDKLNKVISDQTAVNAAQAVTNCGFNSAIAVAQNNINQLLGMTKVVIPSGNVMTATTTS